MKEEMQKATQVGYSRRDRTESERIDDAKATSIILNEGAQTFIEIIGERLVEVQPSTLNLLEQILGSHNLNEAYRQVVRNGGAGGVDKMETSELLPYLNLHKDELLAKLMSGKYRPSSVRRVEIPKKGILAHGWKSNPFESNDH